MESTLTAGLLSGFAQTLIGHPFDTWKVYSQFGKTPEISTFSRIAFRGLFPPLLFNGLYNSFIFTTTHHFPLEASQNAWLVKGGITGFVGGFLCSGMEYFKIRQQCKEIIPKQISIRNILLSTCFRESLGTAVYFKLYYLYGDKPPGGPFLWGGLVGWGSWVISYPLDTCKTRFQLGQVQTWKQAFQQRNFFKGFTSFSIRCFLVNAVGWYTFQKLSSALSSNNL